MRTRIADARMAAALAAIWLFGSSLLFSVPAEQVLSVAPSGIDVIEVNDAASFPSLLDFLAASSPTWAQGIDLGGRILVDVNDKNGKAVPFADWSLSSGGQILARGRAGSDGSYAVYPRSVGPRGRTTLRLETTARGGAGVIDLDTGGPDRVSVDIGSPRALSLPLSCDVVFVVDTTVSMARVLPAVKRAIAAAAATTAALGEDWRGRCSLVLFRDVGDAYLTENTGLEAGQAGFALALAQAEARGGGDVPEALGAGLAAAINNSGFAPEGLRLVFFFTDAPPKGGGEGIPSFPEAVLSAGTAGARIYTIGLGEIPAPGEATLREAAAYTGGAYLSAAKTGPRGSNGSWARGDLSEILSRIIAGETARVEGAAGGGSGDPALAILDEASRRMAASLAYPEAARLRSLSGTVRLELVVGKDGSLLSARVGKGSGSAILDRAALALATSVFPLPNPQSIRASFSMVVTYSLR